MTQRSVCEQEKPQGLEIEDIPETHECDGGDRMSKTIADNLRRALGEEVWQWLKEVSDEYGDKGKSLHRHNQIS